ncbi:unnamed protein product [Boreogadus saida]
MKLSLCLLLFLTVLASALGLSILAPSPVFGRTVLSVTLSHANGLRGDGWFGRTDGYVKVTAGVTTRRTRTIRNNNDPYWRQTLSFASRFRMTYLIVRVWDSDSGFRGRDDYLGGCFVRVVRSIVSRSYNCRIGWRGRVYFSYRYPPYPNSQTRCCKFYTPSSNSDNYTSAMNAYLVCVCFVISRFWLEFSFLSSIAI